MYNYFEENGQKNTVDNICDLMYAIYTLIKQLCYQTKQGRHILLCVSLLLFPMAHSDESNL